jgi:PRTRC genetic system ThiF family protein
MELLKAQKTRMHFTDSYLLTPTNPVTVNLIGTGGTGSRVLSELATIDTALRALGHAGLQVSVFDDDTVSEANLVRQRFAAAELGLNKAVARVNNVNRWFGTNYKAVPYRFIQKNLRHFEGKQYANIFITCCDTVTARLEVAVILKKIAEQPRHQREKTYYWMDFGNGRFTGQVILSTVGTFKQPASKKFTTVAALPFITDEYGDLLKQSEDSDDSPSCSAAEALQKQDLFINPALAQMGCELLYQLFRDGMIASKGLFLNLRDLRMQPLSV